MQCLKRYSGCTRVLLEYSDSGFGGIGLIEDNAIGQNEYLQLNEPTHLRNCKGRQWEDLRVSIVK